MAKLYSWQKELVESKGKNILINWCRFAGKDTAIAYYILENRPSKIFILAHKYYYDKYFFDKILETARLFNNGHVMKDIKPCGSGGIIYFTNGEEVVIDFGKNPGKGSSYDLILNFKNELAKFDNPNVKYNKYIHVIRKNVSDLVLNTYNKFDDISIIDFRDLLIETNDENIVDYILNSIFFNKNSGNTWYDEWALKTPLGTKYSVKGYEQEEHTEDSREENNMNFDEFRQEALYRLQKQFLNTPDTKDTVLTRKAIMEMIMQLYRNFSR